MKDSLKNLMNLFPWFFDKSETSNFYKSQDVTNRRFQELSNDLFKIYESFHLNKRLLIWKDQVESYVYTINFVANFPNLKSVTCYKNDKVIYTESFSYEDNVNSFEYSYSSSTLDEVSNKKRANIIPQHKFKIKVETYDEYSLVKGWPENDTTLGDEFDHDISLDIIGESNDIPRKEYLIVGPEFYPATEPPFNDRASEDDYHYMKRQLEYNLRLHDTPAPVLEIWKLYGIEATLENREKLLLKVFDLEKHPNFIDPNADGDGWFSGTLDETTGEIIEWVPEAWEHKDKFCDYGDILGKYFFVQASTKIPVKNQNVILYFKFVDSLAHELKEDCTVDILLDDQTLYSGLTSSQITLLASEIPEDKENTFIVIGKDSKGEIIGTNEIIINVRGCNNADWYVNPSLGDDTNDGKSRATAFKTIQKAVDSVHGDKNLIVLLGGNYEFTKPVIVNTDCTIMGCGSVLIENLQDNLFFSVAYNCSLVLQDVTVQYLGDVCNVSNTTFTNHNGNGEFAHVILLFTNAPLLVITKLNISFITGAYCVGDTVNFTGTLKDKYGNKLDAKTITVNDSITATTDSNGVYTGSVVADNLGKLTLNASYAGDSTYKSSVATASTNIKLRMNDFLAGYDFVVMDLMFDEDTGDWDYITKSVDEIFTLADLNGAILNLQYNGYDVQFERFSSYSTNPYVSKTEMTKLRGLLVGIEYEDYDVKYQTARIFGDTTLSLSTSANSYLVGDTISFSGTLVDRFNNPLTNKVVMVNNQRCVTDSNGAYTGSITASALGSLKLIATYAGNADYNESSATKNITVRINLADVLSDYTYVVMDLTYDEETKDWDYSTIDVEDITCLADMDNAVKNLVKVDGEVRFERFKSTSTNPVIKKSEVQSLSGVVVAIVYDDYDVKYTRIQ